MSIHAKKIENVLKLNSLDRYDYFIRKVADLEVVWGLFKDGWAMVSVDDQQGIPFWPEAEFAALCASGEWAGFHAKEISVEDFIKKWLPGMNSDKRIASIFPTPDGKPSIVDPKVLQQHLSDELKQYE
jgi:hypothetical protein